MPRAPDSPKPRRKAPAPAVPKAAAGKPPAAEPVGRQAKAAVPAAPAEASRAPAEEPVWLVRAVLVLFLVGFAAFLAREVYGFVQSLP